MRFFTFGLLISVCAALAPLAARAEVRSDDLAIEPGRIRGMTSLVVKVRSKSGLTFNRTSRASLEGGDAFVVNQPSPTEVLVRLYYAASGPARAKLTIHTIHPNPGLIEADGGIDIFPIIGVLPTVNFLSPTFNESGVFITSESAVLLAWETMPDTANDQSVINTTRGTTVSLELTPRPESGLIEGRATLALAPGTNDFILSVFDPTQCFGLVCPGIALVFTIVREGDAAGRPLELPVYRAGVPEAFQYAPRNCVVTGFGPHAAASAGCGTVPGC